MDGVAERSTRSTFLGAVGPMRISNHLQVCTSISPEDRIDNRHPQGATDGRGDKRHYRWERTHFAWIGYSADSCTMLLEKSSPLL